jgi:hypothetical protein
VELILKFTNTRLQREAPSAPPLTQEELWRWLALVITMGISMQPTAKSYWSTGHFGERLRLHFVWLMPASHSSCRLVGGGGLAFPPGTRCC